MIEEVLQIVRKTLINQNYDRRSFTDSYQKQ